MDSWDKTLFPFGGFQYFSPVNYMQFLDKQAQSSSIHHLSEGGLHFQLLGWHIHTHFLVQMTLLNTDKQRMYGPCYMKYQNANNI